MDSLRLRLHATQSAKPKRPASRASALGRAALLGGVWFCALAPGIANAVDGIWTGAGTEWTTGTNWSSAPTVPDNTATFINNGAPTSVTISNDASINTIQFNAAAPAYSITVNAATFAISGGIVNGGNATIVNNPRGVTGFLNSSSADHTTIVNDGVFSPIALGGTVFFLDSSTAASATIFNRHDGFTGFAQTSTAANVTIINSDNGPLSFLSGGTYFFDASSAGTATIVNNSGGIAYFGNTSTAANGTINNNNGGTTYFVESSTAGTATIVNNSGGSAHFGNISTAANAAIINNGGATYFVESSTAGTATIVNNSGGSAHFGNISTAANATIINNGGATYFFDSSTAGAATIITNSGGVTQFNNASTSGHARFRTNAGGTVDISPLTPGGATAGSIEGAGSYLLGSNQFTVGSNNLSTVVSGVIADGGQAGGTGGSLVKVGTGTLVLSGSNLYTGGTTIGAGTLQLGTGGTSGSIVGNVVNNGAFAINRSDTYTFDGVISGTGSFVQAGSGTTILTGASTYTGQTSIIGGALAVNGSLASSVTVNNGGTLSGTGSIGGLVANGGVLAPGNSIGTLTVNGNVVQHAGSTYQVEVNSVGQGDRINATGTATLNGGTVQVIAASGSYAPRTTYTILSATGGVSGAYSNITSNFAFLAPALSYDPNNVFLTLTLSGFGRAAQTPNQAAVGAALDQAVGAANGDFATILSTLIGLSTQQGPAALNAISGQPYADFGTMNTNNSAMFMNALGQQMANARGSSGGGRRQALAQACEVEACDGASPLSAWASALGGLGSVLGDGNASTLTYSFGGAAAGIDYRLDPRFLVGIGVGYTHGTQWVNSFLGQGWSDSVSVAAYGSFTQAGFYAGALAGYAYFNNQLQRQIVIPGLQPRTATGSTGANQFLGQVESGYKLGVYAPAAATITPFGRLQLSSVTQNAFSESGADSLSLNVAQQTTNSLRTTLGADLAGAIGIGEAKKIDLALRLGWMHEFADTGRPITAAFASAPGNSFAVFGATPLRNSAVVGFSATTAIATATQLYLRYDGEIAGGTDNHAINLGVRFSW